MESYSVEYYESIKHGALSSARAVTPLVFGLVRPRSVVDLGCGTGEWLSAFAEHGAGEILGVEQPGFERSLLSVPSESVIEHDLREPFRVDRRFDLAISLEVAEHLPPERGKTFVEDLARLSPVVLFSAAVPGQGGEEHLNERWQSYWAQLFNGVGYEVVDCVRPAVWEDERVEFWYAQNTILYVAAERLASDGALKDAKEEDKCFPLSVIHPMPRLEQRLRKIRKLNKQLKRAEERTAWLEKQLEAERSKGLWQRVLGR